MSSKKENTSDTYFMDNFTLKNSVNAIKSKEMKR